MYRIAVPLPPVEWGQKASPLGVRSHALGRKLSAKQTDEVPLRWLRAFIVAEARGTAFGEDLIRNGFAVPLSPSGEGCWGRKPPSRSPGVGRSFSGAEWPWIHPCGLVLSVHAALGDLQDRGSQNQDGASHVQDGGAHAAGGGLTGSWNYDRIELPARAEGRTQTRRRLLLHLRKEVGTMRITFHIGRYTVTIIVYERKKSNRHSGK